jgi:hypothetical protein
VGNLSIGTNATLTLDALNGFVPSAGDTFAIIQRSGGGGVFAGLPQGALITNFLGSGLGATINYFGGTSGFDVVLSVGSTTTETFVSIDANGNLNILDTVNDSADNLRLHTDGTNLIVVDESATPLLLGTDIAAAVGNGTNTLRIPLNLITGAIRVNVGANNNTRNDRITIDYASGGFFAVPGGIDVAGSNGTEDLLTVLGTGTTQANHSTLMAPLGPLQLRLSDTLGTTAIRYSNFDNLVFTALQTFVAENLLVIGTGSLTVGSNTPVNLPTLTLISGGTFTANQIALGAGEAITGTGTIHARFAGEAGSVLTATGNLSIGNPVAVDGFLTRGEIDVKDHTLTLWDANEAVLGSLTKLGSEPGPAATAGTLVSENGILIDQGNNLIGFGTVEIPNDIALLSYINGDVQGTSTEKPITLTGYIKGIGQLNNVNLTGTYSPGFSPAIAINGSVTYAPDSVLIIELGGTTPGSSGHDQLIHTGTATLGGDLRIELINGFTPQVDDSFLIMTAANGFVGAFDQVVLPTAPSGTKWNLITDSGEVRLTLTRSTPAPRVTEVRIGSTDWNNNFRNLVDPGNRRGVLLSTGSGQLVDVPYINANQLFITFDQPVVREGGGNFQASDFALIGSSTLGKTYNITAVAYDESTHTIALTFGAFFTRDKLLLHVPSTRVRNAEGAVLNGRWITGESLISGDGTGAGNFNFRFDSLPGNVNNDTLTSTTDISFVRGLGTQIAGSTANFNVRANVNGDALVNTTDISAIRLLGTQFLIGVADPTPPTDD